MVEKPDDPRARDQDEAARAERPEEGELLSESEARAAGGQGEGPAGGAGGDDLPSRESQTEAEDGEVALLTRDPVDDDAHGDEALDERMSLNPDFVARVDDALDRLLEREEAAAEATRLAAETAAEAQRQAEEARARGGAETAEGEAPEDAAQAEAAAEEAPGGTAPATPLAAEAPPSATAAPEEDSFTGEEGQAPGEEEEIARPADEEIRRLCGELHPADLADLIEQVTDEHRPVLVLALGELLSAETLVELNEDVRDQVVAAMPTVQLGEAVADMDTDEAAFVLENLSEQDRAEVMAEMPIGDRLALQAAFDYPQESAGRIMQRDVFAAPSYLSVGEIIDRLRSTEELPDRFYEVYVVDPAFRVTGVVPLSRFVRAKRETPIGDIAMEDHPLITDTTDQEEVAYLFEKYNLISAPVVDQGRRLVGMITVDDVVEVVHEEADEDMLALAGVEKDEGGLSIPVPRVARSRFTWLFVNLGTAILASFIIGLFDATIAEVVALAVLMPIVASMGGNAGTQTLTVAVRNLATRDLTGANAVRVIMREAVVSLINGVAFAILLGVAAGLWYSLAGYGDRGDGVILGFVLAAAMVINMLCAGLAGTLVPLGLQKAGADPAVSSAVFVTTVTDVVGFFAFLGLAATFLVGR